MFKKGNCFIADNTLSGVNTGFGVRTSNPGFTKYLWVNYLTFLTQTSCLKIGSDNTQFSVIWGNK